jgi:hypothetical protein
MSQQRLWQLRDTPHIYSYEKLSVDEEMIKKSNCHPKKHTDPRWAASIRASSPVGIRIGNKIPFVTKPDFNFFRVRREDRSPWVAQTKPFSTRLAVLGLYALIGLSMVRRATCQQKEFSNKVKGTHNLTFFTGSMKPYVWSLGQESDRPGKGYQRFHQCPLVLHSKSNIGNTSQRLLFWSIAARALEVFKIVGDSV